MLRKGESIMLLLIFAAACHSSGGGPTGGASANAGTTSTESPPSAGGFAGTGSLSTGGTSSSADTGGRDAGTDLAGRDTALDALSVPDLAAPGRPDSPPSNDLSTEPPRKPDAGVSLKFAVPLYIWPGEGNEWSQVAAAGSAVSYIVANAGDPGGPGPSADSTYTKAISNAHRVGQRVLGYVDTAYASRALSAVSAEVNQWYAFYPEIDGIFLDQTPSETSKIASYLKPASDQIRGKPGAHIVIINPGQPDFPEGCMAVADVAMAYENPYGSVSDGYAPGQYSPPSWMNQYAADRFWHVILEVPDLTAMRSVLDLARTRNAGHVYVTNYADPPAYARLPVYFSEEISALTR